MTGDAGRVDAPELREGPEHERHELRVSLEAPRGFCRLARAEEVEAAVHRHPARERLFLAPRVALAPGVSDGASRAPRRNAGRRARARTPRVAAPGWNPPAGTSGVPDVLTTPTSLPDGEERLISSHVRRSSSTWAGGSDSGNAIFPLHRAARGCSVTGLRGAPNPRPSGPAPSSTLAEGVRVIAISKERPRARRYAASETTASRSERRPCRTQRNLFLFRHTRRLFPDGREKKETGFHALVV